MPKQTLLDIAKQNGNDAVVGLIEENIKYSPEVEVIPARTVRGTSYRTVVRTGLPTTGFRSANDGFAPSKSKFRNELIQAYIFGGRIEVDKAVADAHEDGAEAWQATEASGVMMSAMRSLGDQVFYGTSTDAKGFPGLKAFTPFGGTTNSSDAQTIDAGGTTASTASSVYGVNFGTQDVQMIVGREGAIDLPDFMVESITGNNGQKHLGYVSEIVSWVGMQIGNDNAVRRLLNLTEDSGKGLTDDLMAKLLETYPVGYTPDAFFLSRRSRRQLQVSRTVTLFGNGRSRPNQPNVAPLPTEYDGVPFVVTDSIKNTDAIES